MPAPQKAAAWFIVFVSLFAVPAAHAQFWAKLTAPRVTFTAQHPPLLALKGVTRLAVSEFEGPCGAELTDRLTQLLVDSGKFDVVDRFHLQALLKEHNFSFSGMVDTNNAAQLGKILGPAALIFGRVTRCTNEPPITLKKGTDNQGNITYVTRTRSYLYGSVQLVELVSSRLLAAHTFEGKGEREYEARNEVPEAPSVDEVQTQAYTNFISQVTRLIVPWDERVTLVIHDDDDWGLKKGAGFVKAGQLQTAVELFQGAVSAHERDPVPNPKMYPKALYDLGVALMYSGRPQDGLEYLKKSLALKQEDITTDAMATCGKMIELEKQFAFQEIKGVEVGRSTAPSAAAGGSAVKAPPPAKTDAAKRSTSSVGSDPNTAQSKPTLETIEEELSKLKALYDKKLITKLEYDRKRRAILDKIG